ncbi:MAG: hypothetical protein AAF467_25020 [Actinomycetota bacterium]
MMQGPCCTRLEWTYLRDASHADGFDFTLGACASCQTRLVSVFVVATSKTVYEIADDELVATIERLEGRELKEHMRAWVNTDR